MKHLVEQEFSDVSAGIPLNKIQQFQCTTNLVCIEIKKLKLETLSDSGDEWYNIVSSAAYWQIYVAYVLFIFSIFSLLFFSFLRPCTSKHWLAYQ